MIGFGLLCCFEKTQFSPKAGSTNGCKCEYKLSSLLACASNVTCPLSSQPEHAGLACSRHEHKQLKLFGKQIHVIVAARQQRVLFIRRVQPVTACYDCKR